MHISVFARLHQLHVPTPGVLQFATMDSMTTTAPARAVSVKMAKCVIRLLGAVVSAVTTTSFPCVKVSHVTAWS